MKTNAIATALKALRASRTVVVLRPRVLWVLAQVTALQNWWDASALCRFTAPLVARFTPRSHTVRKLEHGANAGPRMRALLLAASFVHLWGALFMVYFITAATLLVGGVAMVALALLCLVATFITVIMGTVMIVTDMVPRVCAEFRQAKVSAQSVAVREVT